MPLTLSANVRLAVAVATVLALAFALGSDRAEAAGGDFSIDFAAAAPSSYNHSTGGGAFNDRTINEDVVESLNGGDFSCGDIVSFLPRVTVDDGAVATQTITMDFSFGASTTSGGEVGYGAIENVKVNYDVGDTGVFDDGGSTATFTQTTPPSPFTGDLLATVTLNDLDPGEAVVVRIDVRLTCGTGPATGNVQSAIRGAENVIPEGGGSINVGNQTIPLLSPDDVRAALDIDKELTSNADQDGSGSVTLGDSLTYTITVTNTGEVAVSGVTVGDSRIAGLTCQPAIPADLAIDATIVCTGTYVVGAGDVAAGAIVNTATGASDQTPPVQDQVTTPVTDGGTPPVTPPAPTAPPAGIASPAPTPTSPPATVAAPPTSSAPRARLRATKIGPRRLTGGRNAVYRIVVRNASRVVARNVRIIDALPRGVVLRGRPARSRIRGRRIHWNVIPRIAPGRRVVRIVRVRVLASTRGRRCNNVVARAGNAPRTRARTCALATPRRTPVQPAVTG